MSSWKYNGYEFVLPLKVRLLLFFFWFQKLSQHWDSDIKNIELKATEDNKNKWDYISLFIAFVTFGEIYEIRSLLYVMK